MNVCQRLFRSKCTHFSVQVSFVLVHIVLYTYPRKRWKEKYQSVDEVLKRSIKHEMLEESIQVYMKCFMPKESKY